MMINDMNPSPGDEPDHGEDITRLYVAPIGESEQEPQVVQFITLDGPQSFQIYGEIVLEAGQEVGYAPVVVVRRLALYGSPVEKPATGEDQYGVVSIVGSSLPLTMDERVAGSQTFHFPATLYYRALSERPAFHARDTEGLEDAEFPSVELMQVTVAISGADYSEEAIHLTVEIRAELAKHMDIGLVQEFAIEPNRRVFLQGGTGEPRGKPTHSLSSHCEPPEFVVNAPCMDTLTRQLPVKFVNFTQQPVNALEPLCQKLIDRVCEVWRNQAALDLTVEGMIQDAHDTDKNRYGASPSPTIQKELETCSYASDTHIEVYICTELDANYNGAIARACPQASAFCLLDLDLLESNDLVYLLAHELGHVLGLLHPNEHPTYGGSVQSIMAGANDTNHRCKNTLHNCGIFSMQAKEIMVGGVAETVFWPLNPIVKTTTIKDCFRPLENCL